MKTFKDLVFKPRYSDLILGKQAKLKFDNNYEVSVLLGGLGIYSNGIDTYELAVGLNNKICYLDIIPEGIVGYINKKKVSKYMRMIQELPKYE